MTVDIWVLAAIVGMALATYVTRAGGYLLFRSVKPSHAARDMLGYIPGALFVSYVAPALVVGGIQQWAGAAATLLIMATTKHLALSILGGTGVAWLVWSVQ